MASIRRLKKDVDYLVSEVVSDCCTSILINKNIKKEDVLSIIEEAIDLRNSLFDRINNPAEKDNKQLVKKHYYLIRENLFDSIDSFFVKLSDICKNVK